MQLNNSTATGLTIPASLSGVYTISAVGADPSGSLRVLSSPLTVTAAPATSSALSDSVVFALAGAAIVILAGLLLLGTQLRRSRR